MIAEPDVELGKRCDDIRECSGEQREAEGCTAPVPPVSHVRQGISVSGMPSGNPYLFPAPASAFRGLLDFAASQGKEFSDDEAALDLMLAMDRGKVKPFRYLAKRWGWSYHKVRTAFKGDERYDTPPWIEEKVNDWRTFYGSTQQASSDQKSNHTQSKSNHTQSKNGAVDTYEGDKQSQSNQKQSESNQYSTDTELDTDKKITTSNVADPFTKRDAEIWFREHGVSDAARVADEFYEYHEARDFTYESKGKPVRIHPDTWWRNAATWKRNLPKYNQPRKDDGSQWNGNSAKPKRGSRFDPEIHAENQRRYGHLLGGSQNNAG